MTDEKSVDKFWIFFLGVTLGVVIAAILFWREVFILCEAIKTIAVIYGVGVFLYWGSWLVARGWLAGHKRPSSLRYQDREFLTSTIAELVKNHICPEDISPAYCRGKKDCGQAEQARCWIGLFISRQR